MPVSFSSPTLATMGANRRKAIVGLAAAQATASTMPSEILPRLYLTGYTVAANEAQLLALGITHVVSVGECALVPPPDEKDKEPQPLPGSLWIEEREGRIKVLDIKGVCDDGIDTLEPQLEPICDWIDKARAEGGQVLVHCRVGVSRSATVVVRFLRLPRVSLEG